MNATTRTFTHSSALRCLAVAGVAALLATCASASPQPLHQSSSDVAAKAEAEVRAAQAAARDAAAKAQAEADLARERANAAAKANSANPMDNLTSVVVNVSGNAEEMAHALASSLMGTVAATPLGSAVVITGAPDRVHAAQKLLEELNERAHSDRAQREAEMQKMEEMRRVQVERNLAATDRVFDVNLGPTLEASLTSISKALAESGGQGLNVVFTNTSDAAMPIRAVELRRVTVASAVRTLQSMQVSQSGEARVNIDIGRANNPQERPVVTVTPTHAGQRGGDNTEYQIAVFRLDSIAPDADPADRARIEKDQATTLEAIDVGLEIVGRTPEFKIKLHPATGMMFVHGTRAQIRVISDILGQNVDITPAPSPAAAPAPAAATPKPTR